MCQLFILAALLTIALALIAYASIILGIIFCFFRRLRIVGLFILFVPTLTALGAAAGAWGCGYIGCQINEWSSLPILAWILGLPLGGGLGLVLGFAFALLVRKLLNLSKQKRQPKSNH